jgi:hypothetical protein
VSTDYTVDRHLALLLVARGRIVVRGCVPCRCDGGQLSADVLTALATLERDGLVTSPHHQIPSTESTDSALLTVSGVQKLNRFDQEHGRPAKETASIETCAEPLGAE